MGGRSGIGRGDRHGGLSALDAGGEVVERGVVLPGQAHKGPIAGANQVEAERTSGEWQVASGGGQTPSVAVGRGGEGLGVGERCEQCRKVRGPEAGAGGVEPDGQGQLGPR